MASKEGHVNGGPDWPELLSRLRRQSYLSQQRIAESCGVAPQTVSAWKNRRRTPGLYAARKLLDLFREHHVSLEAMKATDYTTAPAPAAEHELYDAPSASGLSSQEQSLLDYFRKASPTLRPGLLAFAKFVASQP